MADGSCSRLSAAFDYACALHHNQMRKGTRVPYLTHLMSVCALVLEAGGDEDQAVAALLHDAVEDQGGLATLNEIRSRFGERVARIVDGCTDAYGSPKPPWNERKQRYLDHLQGLPTDILLVSLADKVHNARTIVADLRREGPRTLDRFNGGREGTLWYYRSLVEAFAGQSTGFLGGELARLVDEIERLAALPGAGC
jgi:(p)ppGpp synthase/HD superfamily hydrolase